MEQKQDDWKTVNTVNYDVGVNGSFKYLGKNFKYKELI